MHCRLCSLWRSYIIGCPSSCRHCNNELRFADTKAIYTLKITWKLWRMLKAPTLKEWGSKFYPKKVIQIWRLKLSTQISHVKIFIQKFYPKCHCWNYDDNIGPKLKKPSFAILGANNMSTISSTSIGPRFAIFWPFFLILELFRKYSWTYKRPSVRSILEDREM